MSKIKKLKHERNGLTLLTDEIYNPSDDLKNFAKDFIGWYENRFSVDEIVETAEQLLTKGISEQNEDSAIIINDNSIRKDNKIYKIHLDVFETSIKQPTIHEKDNIAIVEVENYTNQLACISWDFRKPKNISIRITKKDSLEFANYLSETQGTKLPSLKDYTKNFLILSSVLSAVYHPLSAFATSTGDTSYIHQLLDPINLASSIPLAFIAAGMITYNNYLIDKGSSISKELKKYIKSLGRME
jgi:hypothetical protein